MNACDLEAHSAHNQASAEKSESLEHAQVSSVRSTVGIHSIRPLLTWLPKRPRDLPDKAGLRLHQEHGPISSEWAKFSQGCWVPPYRREDTCYRTE